MYIRVLKTWCGIEGMFTKDEIREVDEAVLKKIAKKKGSKKEGLEYEEVAASWDAQKDEAAVRVAELQGEIAKAAVELERLEDELLNMQYRAGPGIGCAVGVLENAEHDHVQAERCLKELSAPAAAAQANAGRKPTKANRKKAADLAAKEADAVRVEKEKRCLVVKAQGQLLVLNGDIGLTELEVADAQSELAAMQTELYELRPDLKPKGDEDGQERQESEVRSQESEGGGEKDAADAKGQTVAAGQTHAVQN